MTHWASERADAPLLTTGEQVGPRSQLEHVGAPVRRLGQTRGFSLSLSLSSVRPREEFGVSSGRDGGLSARTLLGNDWFCVPTQPAVSQQDTIAAVQATMTAVGPSGSAARGLGALA